MLKIYKYPLIPNDIIKIKLPKGAIILTAQSQFDVPCIWALVNPNIETEERLFKIIGTGYDISESNLIYIDTIQISAGTLIFHIFEIKES